MDRDVVMHRLTERFQELMGKGLDAVERAPDGQWIAASEGVFLDVCHQLSKEMLEAALQVRIDAHSTAKAATFSPCGPGAVGSTTVAAQGHRAGGGLESGR